MIRLSPLSKKLKEENGETLMESVASLLIFAVLMLAVAAMVSTALKITTIAAAQNKKSTDTIVKVEKQTTGTSSTMTFTISEKTINQPILVFEPTIVDGDDDIKAFIPVVTP